MNYFEDLKQAILNEDFCTTNEIIEKIKLESNGFEYVEPLLLIMEENPNIDFGAPGPATHFVESYYKRGYEKLLLESINRFPTNQTLWMLNRIINDVNLENRELYLEAMENVSHRNDVDDSVRNEAQHFYKYQKEK